jgi:ubiquinone/menaquinone biosynthesis C-methylase UbiE
MDEQRVAEFYDVVGNSYDRSLYFLACDPLYEAEIGRITRGRRFRRILDLGCGTGKQTVLLAPHAEEVWAFDLSAASLRQAQARCAQAGVRNARFFQQSIVTLPAEDGSVDAIFSYGDVISHVHDAYRQVFAECARVLSPDGVLAFEVDGKWELDMLLHHPAERGQAWAARGVGHLRIWEGNPCKTFTQPELRQILAKAGLRMVRCRGVNIFHCLLPERVLMGLPEEVGGGWRFISDVLERVDRVVGRLPWFPRLGSTRLVAAVKD